MKKLAHSNLVRLYEVIDSPADDKLFLVLELIRGGQIMYWDDKTFRYFSRNTPTGVLDKDTVRACMRDVVAALDFRTSRLYRLMV
jgi:serine/threonine protein kinase